MRTLTRSKYRELLDDVDFKRWYDNIARGSLVTAQEWFRRMGFLCDLVGTTPKLIAKMSEKQASDFILDVIGRLEREGRSGNYIANIVKPVKSWLAWNDVHITRAIKIPRTQSTKIENERPPTPQELRKILNAAELRARAACALVAFSGCRIEVLGNYTGDDGLKIKDLSELRIDQNGSVSFEVIPALITVRKTMSKAGHKYFTFLSEEGCQYVQQYLEWRLRHEEVLAPESPVITFHERKGKYVEAADVGRKHITSINMGDIIRKPIRAAGFDWRPYVLRRYFDVRMMMAESEGLIIRDWREFWMGHKGDIEATYTVNKGVTQDVIEKMRDAYKKSEPLLSTERQEMKEEKIKQTFREQLLLVAGFKKEEIGKMDLASIADEELQQTIRQKLLGVMANHGNRQRVVPVGEVRELIPQGWEYVAQLPTGEAIVKLP